MGINEYVYANRKSQWRNRNYLKTKPGLVGRASNPSAWEAEAGRLPVIGGQPVLHK